MAPRVSDDVKEQIRQGTDMVGLVRRTVELKRSGASFKGLCPFHNENTPSFNVNPERGTYYCFGCQAGGDAFRFVQETRGLSFPEALQLLAAEAGIELSEEPQTESERAAEKARRDRVEEARRFHELAASFFEQTLRGQEGGQARAYLKSRGISEGLSAQFRLGCAPKGWDLLLRHLERNGVKPEQLVRVGLAKARQSGSGEYDTFRDRLITPVIDAFDKVIAFSGRRLDDEDDSPKYINSPESVIYTKGDHLFGLAQARRGIRERQRVILVEGNFDVLSLHEAGFGETVGILGTALTPAQVTLLKRRRCETVYLFLDADEAGQKATREAVARFVEADMLSKVVALPGGGDPDSFVREHGAEALEQALEQAPTGVEHVIRSTVPGRSAASEIKDRALQVLGALVSKISSRLARAEYRRLTADLLGVDEGLIGNYFRDSGAPRAEPALRHRETASEDPSAELLLETLLRYPEAAGCLQDAEALSSVREQSIKEALSLWLERTLSAGEPPEGSALLESLDGRARRVVARALTVPSTPSVDTPPTELAKQLVARLKQREFGPDPESVREIDALWAQGAEEETRARLQAIVDKARKKRQT